MNAKNIDKYKVQHLEAVMSLKIVLFIDHVASMSSHQLHGGIISLYSKVNYGKSAVAWFDNFVLVEFSYAW